MQYVISICIHCKRSNVHAATTAVTTTVRVVFGSCAGVFATTATVTADVFPYCRSSFYILY